MKDADRVSPRFIDNIRGRFVTLFAVLILTLLLYPSLGALKTNIIGLGLLYVVIPVAAMQAVSYARKNLSLALFLGVPTVAVGIERLVETSLVPDVVRLCLALAFYLFVTTLIVAHILRRSKITTDTLYGAVCGYIMLGLTWVHAYALVEFLDPGSFSSGADLSGPLHLVYFSFVTLATLGYGDITPVSPHAQSLAILEAITGTLYIAVLIARLVGLYTARSRAGGA